jgi:hypothetical protein
VTGVQTCALPISFAFQCTASTGGKDLVPDFRGFQNSHFIATTVDLLSTGVDVPCVRHIVFFRYIQSPILFHQMVGRGTRIDEKTDKLMFTLWDYTGATALFGRDFESPPPGGGGGEDGPGPTPPPPPPPVRIRGTRFKIEDSGDFQLHQADGRPQRVTLAGYQALLAQKLAALSPNLADFRSRWIDLESRADLLDALEAEGLNVRRLPTPPPRSSSTPSTCSPRSCTTSSRSPRANCAERFLQPGPAWLVRLPSPTARSRPPHRPPFEAADGTEALETMELFRQIARRPAATPSAPAQTGRRTENRHPPDQRRLFRRMKLTKAPLGDLLTEARARGSPPENAISRRSRAASDMNNVGTQRRVHLGFVSARPSRLGVDRVLFAAARGCSIQQHQHAPQLVGKSALFTGYSEPVVFSNHFTRLRTAAEKLDPGYLARWLNHQWRSKVFENLCNRWVGQSAIQLDALLPLELPLPPLSRQREIVARLDAQLAAAARARAAVATQLAEAERLLTKWINDVFARAETEGIPQSPLDTHASIQAGVTLGKDYPPNETVTVPYLRVANVKDGRLDLDDIKSIAVPQAVVDGLALRFGDLLLTEGGDPDKLGRGTIWRNELSR